jgi:DNA modification methylase
VFAAEGVLAVERVLDSHVEPSPVAQDPPTGGVSAGKNSYTYDAHTYHTKVPPQGIAELLNHYLPEGGLVLDPFGGSGMTGVAAAATGHDCLINELSPAACFIASRFLAKVDPAEFRSATEAVLRRLADVRSFLYTTTCRECGRGTEILYTVWSYRVICGECAHEFLLWDVCRSYGRTVREHRILNEFQCPCCRRLLLLGYICCGSRQQETLRELTPEDRENLRVFEQEAESLDDFAPRVTLPDGVNLNQPKRHGLDRTDKFYTARNLIAMASLWKTIHQVGEDDLAAHLAFAFTSLYQRVTRLSEFRFWGGSGNTARFNVPFIFNEANVFITFERKARSIEDHLATTATHYSGKTAVINGSATRLAQVPDESVDLIFTDPPFGANINYSEMNLLWEAWLGSFTDTASEAIVSRSQGKTVGDYERLMTDSLREAYRVLRSGHWMLLVFMNSSARVWDALRSAIVDAGFVIVRADSFDKQHGTFKQFVSENTAGEDLVLHCRKPDAGSPLLRSLPLVTAEESVRNFLASVDLRRARTAYLHVDRSDEVDARKLYSEWLSHAMVEGIAPIDLAAFRAFIAKMGLPTAGS